MTDADKGLTPDNPLPTLKWPNGNPPAWWWGRDERGELTKVFRSMEDYCNDWHARSLGKPTP